MTATSEKLWKELIAKINEENETEQYFTTDAHNYSYAKGLNEFLKLTNDDDRPDVVKAIIEEVQILLQNQKNLTTLRICSFGCGDGKLDKKIIEEILLKYPSLSIYFVGIEVNKVSYEEAKNNLGDQDKLLRVQFYQEDFMNDIPEEPFDLVLAIHSFYHVESGLKAIEQAKKFVKVSGTLFLSLTREGPLNEPLRLIWKRWKEPIFSLKLTEILEDAGISVIIKTTFSSQLNLTEAISDNFTASEQICLLSFLTSTPMEKYSIATRRACIDFFKAEAKENSNGKWIKYEVDYFVIRNNSD